MFLYFSFTKKLFMPYDKKKGTMRIRFIFE